MSIVVLFDTIINQYYVWDSDEKEYLNGSDDKMTWNTLNELPEEFFGSDHSYTIDEVDFSLLKGM